ncbi:dihydroxyacetone kinase subunit DhaK [Lachnospiraceae bacterium C1.1]|nr:dihydroxyacetone kinase subunit DhaK [Lachnospiraceae bacterium C1.1]
MKKFINSVDQVENEMATGFAKAYPQYLKKIDYGNVFVRTEKDPGKVAILCGSGSGHEPGHCGYVGKGMLDAFVAGPIFTSPTPDLIYEGIKAVQTDKGVLLMVMNYSGDIMNFEMAAEMAEADGIKVDKVIINDDVAVEDQSLSDGRHGVAGSVLVNKITGAKAESGASLEEVKAVAEKAIDNVRSMGAAISPCTLPSMGKPGFEIAEDEIEIGIGVHGEPGTFTGKSMPVNDLVDIILDRILNDIDYNNSEVAVMINSAGATPLMELYIINDHVADVLAEKNIKVHRTFCGHYKTSIDMAGFSISLMKLDDELKKLLDAAADTPSLTIR